jgi:ribose 5-phosphate isomerase A
VPVEVIPLAERAVARDLAELGSTAVQARMEGKKKFMSDNGNLILHAVFPEIFEPDELEEGINRIAGVVDNGIFAQKKTKIVVGKEDSASRALG